MTTPVVASLLLKPDCSNPEQLTALRAALDAMGLRERTEGRASFTVRVMPARFEELFGVRPTPLPSQTPGLPPGPADRGSPSGYACERDPVVPAALEQFVATVGVEPPAIRF